MKNQTRDHLLEFSDEELVKELAGSREAVLGIIYERYEKLVYFKVYSMVGKKQVAEDLTHDIFMKIFTNLGRFEGKSSFSLWLHSISVNSCISFLRSNKKNIFGDLEESAIENLADDVDQRRMLRDIKLGQMMKIMQVLEPGDRLILTLKYIDGLAINEIQKMLDIGLSAVKMRLKRARQKMLELYVENFE